jgi:hypothetical protein
MPKPAMLPTINWREVFASGADFDAWIAAAENPRHREAMMEALGSLQLEPHIEGMLQSLPRPVHVVAIAEDWCGDVVRHVPVLERLNISSNHLSLRFVTCEQHPDVFIRFLTNGGEAIPKFIFLSDQFVECGHWGPYPRACHRVMARGKACGDMKAARARVAALYAADPDRREVIAELVELIGIASSLAP